MCETKSKLPRGRPRTTSPEAVLQVASEAYWREGPGVSVNAICQRAGVTKPSLYREFGSEDGLTLASLEHYAGMVQTQMEGLLSSKLGFAAKLEALIDFISEDSRYEHGCLFVKMRAARLDLGPKTRAKVAEIDAAMLETYKSFFRSSRRNGDWLGRMAPSFAAQYLHAQIGLAASQRALGVKSTAVKLCLQYALSVLRH